MLDSLKQRLTRLLDRARSMPYVGVLVRAAEKGMSQNDKDMAASIAYFTFLSLFPLVLGLVSLSGYVLRSEDAQLRVNSFIVEALPVSAEFVTQITDSLVRIRGAVGVTSALVLIWSARKMVGALNRVINRALGQKRNYAIFLSPLRNFGITLLVATVIVLTLGVSPFLEVLAELQLDFIGESGNALIQTVASRTASLLVTVLMAGVIFLLIPHHRLPFDAMLPGLGTATVLIEVGKTLFVWYVETASNYSSAYGSISSMIVLLIWLYVAARIVIYAAQVISVNMQER